MDNKKIKKLTNDVKVSYKKHQLEAEELKNGIREVVGAVDKKYSKIFFKARRWDGDLEIRKMVLTINYIPLKDDKDAMYDAIVENMIDEDYEIVVGASVRCDSNPSKEWNNFSSVSTSEYDDEKLDPLTIEEMTPELLTVFLEKAISDFGFFKTKKEALNNKVDAVVENSRRRIEEKKKEIQELEKEINKLTNSK